MRKQREQKLFEQRGNITRALFYLNAVLWLLLSLNTLAEMVLDDNGLSVVLVAFFLLMNVLALFFSGRLLKPTEKWTYILALIVVALNIFVTFTGIPELLYITALVIDGIILWMLVSIRGTYFN